MKKFGVLAFLFLSLFCAAAFAAPGESNQAFISTASLHPGMIGYGKTVFHGTKISTFQVVILGILHKAIADTDLILVRINSPYLEKRGIGLVAGMSGSPVYFNGKLAGAIAYGWPFTKEAIAGVTPIQAMLSAQVEGKNNAVASSSPRIFRLSPPIRVGDRTIDSVSATNDADASFGAEGSMMLQPLGATISASGFGPAGIHDLQGLFPMASVVPGGVKMRVSQPVPLEPGQSVGAALIQGDMNVVATGTLTYRDGTRILAFGHPFLFLGDVDFPLVQSYVHFILPSLQLPFKFVSSIKDIGHVAEDRLYGIGGVLGSPAHMIPMDITVTDQERNVARHYHVEIIRYPELTPKLVALAVGQAIPATVKLLGGATATVDYTIKFAGFPAIHKKDMIFSEDSIPVAATGEVLRPILEVAENDFQKVNLESVSVNVSVQPGLAAATLQKITLDKHTVKPGQSITLTAWLKPYNGTLVTRKFTIPIPPDVEGNVVVGVAGGVNEDDLKKALAMPTPVPMSVSQMIRQIQDEPPYDSLVVGLQFPRAGMNLAGENFKDFPAAYIELLKSAGSEPLLPHSDGTELRFTMPWVVVGSALEQVSVQAGSLQNSAPPSGPPAPQQPPSAGASSGFSVPEGMTVQVAPSPKNLPASKSQTEQSPSSVNEDASKSEPLEEGDTHLATYASLSKWENGTLKNLSVSSSGTLALAPETQVIPSPGQSFIFTLAEDGNALFVGTANPGKIYKVSADAAGKTRMKLFFDPQSLAVLSLAALPNGNLLAGTINGEVYMLTPDGKLSFSFKLPNHYIWQILPVKNTLYLATGDPNGTIFALDESNVRSGPKVYARTAQSNVLSLYPLPDGTLLAGTAGGLILKIGAGGIPSTVANLSGKAILSMTADESGNLYFGTDDGKIFVMNPRGEMRTLGSLPEKQVTWLGMKGGRLLAATGIPARLYAIAQDGALSLLWSGKSNEVYGMRGDETGNWFVYSGSRPAAFKLLPTQFSGGEFVSDILDHGSQTIWGRLLWHGSTLPGEIEVQTRSGNSPVPDSTWSSWSTPYASTGEAIQSTRSRYLQFRIRFRGQNTELSSLSFFWRPVNRPPSISLTAPAAGEAIGPKSVIKARIEDPDGDTLLVKVWKTNGEKMDEVFSRLYPTHPNVPQTVEIPLKSLTLQDGPVSFRVTVSDSPSNPAQYAFTANADLSNLSYVSTLPTLTITGMKMSGNSLEVDGTAEAPSSYVKGVEFRTNGGDWLATIPSNGLFDSPKESFSFQIDNVSAVKTMEIRAVDAAGNETTLLKSLQNPVARGAL